MATPHFFNLLGYGVVFVNFRGSLGNGRKSVDCLPGHIGDLDVKDCRQALSETLDVLPCLDKDKVFMMGGSHGGFLVLHLAGQYPDDFKGAFALVE